jgi:hypothetical protein
VVPLPLLEPLVLPVPPVWPVSILELVSVAVLALPEPTVEPAAEPPVLEVPPVPLSVAVPVLSELQAARPKAKIRPVAMVIFFIWILLFIFVFGLSLIALRDNIPLWGLLSFPLLEVGPNAIARPWLSAFIGEKLCEASPC